MNRTSVLTVAAVLVVGFSVAASAQNIAPRPDMPTALDCGNPASQVEYYCSHRDEFDSSGRWLGARQPVASAAQPAAGIRATGSTRTRATRRVQ
jgi:hypothetical protein